LILFAEMNLFADDMLMSLESSLATSFRGIL